MNNSDALKRFGSRLRQLRLERNLSQEDLAELCGLHRTYLGGIERGERNVALLNILKIAKALGTSPTDFFQEPQP
jgi:transcriptional regulator with XRE-family HTH domain